MFDNFNVNLRKNEGFLTSIPCIPIPEYGQSNAPSVSYQSRHSSVTVSRPMGSIVGTKTSVQAHWRKNARKLLTISSCERHGVFSSMFRKISVSKQSISLAFMFLRMLRSCFITNIRCFFCFLRKISDLCVRCGFQ